MSNLKYLKIISKIEKIRSKNNINWMNILRLAFKLDPNSAKKIMKKLIMMTKKSHNCSINLVNKKKISFKKKYFLTCSIL